MFLPVGLIIGQFVLIINLNKIGTAESKFVMFSMCKTETTHAGVTLF